MAEWDGRGVAVSHTVHVIDPLTDPRWTGFAERHPAASAFHSRGWLRALQMTYGYEPLAVTTSMPTEPLRNALLFCLVRSVMTGGRLVSLPFTDHCEPLVDNIAQLRTLCAYLETLRRTEGCKYTEVRTSASFLGVEDGFRKCTIYEWHRLDLRSNLDTVYKGFHKDCIRRRIRHAERQGLEYEEGQNESLVRSLYDLNVLTRVRKRVPPQPFEWFHNLVGCMGKDVCIRVAFKESRPIAGILTMNHRKTMYYKYGGSDVLFNHLGAIPMLIWQAIQAAKSAGMEELDFGRSDAENRGLIRFKERWGAYSVPLTLWRRPADTASLFLGPLKASFAKAACEGVPSKMLVLVGRLLYRHIG